jgi:hypothetical protein
MEDCECLKAKEDHHSVHFLEEKASASSGINVAGCERFLATGTSEVLAKSVAFDEVLEEVRRDGG